MIWCPPTDEILSSLLLPMGTAQPRRATFRRSGDTRCERPGYCWRIRRGGIKRTARAPVYPAIRSLLMRARCVAFIALFALTVAPAPVRSEDKTKTPTLIVRVQ